MSNKQNFEFLDVLVIFVQKKILLATTFIFSVLISYATIYFLIDEEFVASATILPAETGSGFEGIFSLADKFSDFLPAGMEGLGPESQMDLFNVIIYSRTSMEILIDKFNLMQRYKFKNRDKAVKEVRKLIETNITMQNAFLISSRFDTRQLAADVTNYLVDYLNKKVIELNISKASDNRKFLEKRYSEIIENLKQAENALKDYQETNKVFEAEVQAKKIIEVYAELESDLAERKMEWGIIRNIYGNHADKTKKAGIAFKELQKTIYNLKNKSGGVLVPIDSLPKAALGYFRLYRDVEIYNKMLKFIIPIYEQAKYDEHKRVPVLNVIDEAVPPIKKSYPQRTFSSVFIGTFLTLCLFSFIIFRAFMAGNDNPKLRYIKKELFKLRKN